MSLSLPSGRNLATRVLRIDHEGLFVLDLHHPPSFPIGATFVARWSASGRWFEMHVVVEDPPAEGYPGAGMLRLRSATRPKQHRTRRDGHRVAVRLTVRGTVIEAARLARGVEVRATTEDISLTGLSFATEHGLRVGDRLSLTLFARQGGQIAPSVEGRIVRINSRPGLLIGAGVVFVDPTPALADVIRRLGEDEASAA